MLSSIHIDGYRGLRDFQMSGLGRINLLVGTNYSGKTSVLEAIYLLSSMGDPAALWQLLWRRGERLPPTLAAVADRPLSRLPAELDVSHLFTGHEAQPGSSFRIAAENESPKGWIDFQVKELSPREQPEFFPADEETGITSRLAIELSGFPRPLAT